MTRGKRLFLVGCLILGLFIAKDSVHRLYYRLDYEHLILASSNRHRLSPHLVAALIFTESRFRANAESEVGAIGLMQLMPGTAAELAQQEGFKDFQTSRLLDPEINISLGTRYLGQLSRQFESETLALAAYNAGPNQVRTWLNKGEEIRFPETRAYVSNIIKHKGTLEYLYPDW